MGTRFISARESNANDEYKSMIINSNYEDLRMTNLFTGAEAYYLKDSILKNNLDPDNLESNLDGFNVSGSQDKIKAWKDVWSAGRHQVKNGQHINRENIISDYSKVIRELGELI